MKKVLFILLFTGVFIACNNEIESVDSSKEMKGRFDNTPFKWDTVVENNSKSSFLYVGDNIFSQTRNVNKDQLFAINHIGYLGGVYTESSFKELTFAEEIVKPRNPAYVYFKTANMFFAEITAPIRSFGYKMAFKEFINSNEYEEHYNSLSTISNEFRFTQYYSLKDVEKSFSSNTNGGKFFTAKIKLARDSRKIRENGKLFAQIIVPNFGVEIESQDVDYFKNREDNINKEGYKPVYIKEIIYGAIAFLSIESEYSYDEVSWALTASMTSKVVNSNNEMKNKVKQIMSKSNIVVYSSPGDSSNQPFIVSSDIEVDQLMQLLQTAFTVKFNKTTPGVPLYVRGRYIDGDKALELNDKPDYKSVLPGFVYAIYTKDNCYQKVGVIKNNKYDKRFAWQRYSEGRLEIIPDTPKLVKISCEEHEDIENEHLFIY